MGIEHGVPRRGVVMIGRHVGAVSMAERSDVGAARHDGGQLSGMCPNSRYNEGLAGATV